MIMTSSNQAGNQLGTQKQAKHGRFCPKSGLLNRRCNWKAKACFAKSQNLEPAKGEESSNQHQLGPYRAAP